jgi:hypothetical protein
MIRLQRSGSFNLLIPFHRRQNMDHVRQQQQLYASFIRFTKLTHYMCSPLIAKLSELSELSEFSQV